MTGNATVVCSLSIGKNYWFMVSFPRFSDGVKFRHSTYNASRIQRKVENGSVLMRTKCRNTMYAGAVCFCGIMRETACKKIFHLFN